MKARKPSTPATRFVDELRSELGLELEDDVLLLPADAKLELIAPTVLTSEEELAARREDILALFGEHQGTGGQWDPAYGSLVKFSQDEDDPLPRASGQRKRLCGACGRYRADVHFPDASARCASCAGPTERRGAA